MILNFRSGPCAEDAQVAQLVEHATENRSVGGSIPPLGTISLSEDIYRHPPLFGEPGRTCGLIETKTAEQQSYLMLHRRGRDHITKLLAVNLQPRNSKAPIQPWLEGPRPQRRAGGIGETARRGQDLTRPGMLMSGSARLTLPGARFALRWTTC